MQNLRDVLAKHGFLEEDHDMMTRWMSRQNPRGERIGCEIAEAFRGEPKASWYITKPNGGSAIPAPASEECLVALMGEMGVPRGGGA
jgi:hypothetical protein